MGKSILVFVKSYTITILWMIILLVLSGISGEKAKELNFLDFFQADKLSHLIAYMILAFLLMRSLTINHSKKSVKIALIVSILYGILMELMQYCFFIERYFEFPDIIANIIGALLGVYIFRIIKNQFYV